ncbi:MAG: FkbM family methyltransferase [Planctomycetes bacterium]|nr:FkbM family methyltransferase [Planctomycetota bacterium]
MRKAARWLVKLLIRSYPLYRGGVRLADMSWPRRLTDEERLVLTRLRHGPHILVYLNDYCGRALYYWGDTDRKITWLCQRLLRPGDCLLDIGANYGEVGLFAGQSVGPSGQVHIFEPQPKLAECIRVSAELNGYRHVYTHAVALSDRDGEADLVIPRGCSCRGSLSTSGREGDRVRVPLRRAGPYLAQLGLPHIRILKLDVEHHEEQVLAGAWDFLAANTPAAIIFESHDDGQPFSERGAVRKLSELGYRFFQIRQKPLFRVQLKELRGNGSVESGYDFVGLSSDPEGQDARRALPIL